MNDEIQFGEVEQQPPRVRRRPDLDRHFAAARVGTGSGKRHADAVDSELPIFVDLDAMREMEAHARTDPTTELGGVLLGGTFEDESGRPFVFVVDCVRARHVETSRGSIKFTHDTWSAITEERQRFDPELAMVGWYHTHPDWGVFLSGMDMFICDNFFNKPLDVALVIDPCRAERGWFQWTGDPRERIRRTTGFFLTTSRCRQDELNDYVSYLEGSLPMPIDSRSGSLPAGLPPVIHLSGERNSTTTIAVLGMITIQSLFLGLLGWRMISTRDSDAGRDVAAAVQVIGESRAAEARREGQTELLDRVLSELTQAPAGSFRTMTELQQRNEELAAALRGQLSRERELSALNQEQASRLEKLAQQLDSQTKESRDKQDRFQSRLDEQAEELAKLRKLRVEGEEATDARWYQNWNWYSITISFALGAVVTAAASIWRRASSENPTAAKDHSS
jgi:proteasome lid subunit RPN8/RPN11